ncbi:MAG: VTT domain-containing protein [Thermoanaerobaculia bacterium]
MNEAVEFLLRNGYVVLFLFVFAEQIGLPLPALPILLAMGALAGAGEMSYGLALATAVAASVVSDLIWYSLGRTRGSSILNLLCRIALEPDSCVRRTEETFAGHGARALLYAKFVPGLNTAAPPLAGLFHMKLTRFLVFDSLGALLYLGAFSLLGLIFSEQLERVATVALQLGGWLVVLLVGGLAGYIAWKYVDRRRFLRRLRIARIAPEELHQKIAAGEDVLIVDLRHSLDFEAEPATLPGALHIPPDELEQRHAEIPRGRELILYCT